MKRQILFCLLPGLSFTTHAQLEGMIGVHMHSAPDSMPHSIDALQAACEGEAAAMRAIVLKNYTQTAVTA